MSTMNFDVSFIGRCSSLTRLLHIFAYCLRFGRRKEIIAGSIQANEIFKATQCVVRLVQAQYWTKEIDNLKIGNQAKSKIFYLRPFLDQDQILRVGSRLKNANILDISQCQPMLIPQSCTLSKLIFRETHVKITHGGPAAMFSYAREGFWPIH